MAIIRNQINDIHQSFEKLNVDEMIPCNCSECRDSLEPHFYKYVYLQKCQIKRKDARCEISIEDVSIENLFKGVFLQKRDVFISYSRVDSDIIKRIINDLNEKHITYWVDFEQIDPGNIIAKNINQGLNICQNMLLCLSYNFLDSDWGQLEYSAKLSEILNEKDNKRKLIPLIIDDLKNNELPALIKGIKCIRLSDKDVYNKLLISLKKK